MSDAPVAVGASVLLPHEVLHAFYTAGKTQALLSVSLLVLGKRALQLVWWFHMMSFHMISWLWPCAVSRHFPWQFESRRRPCILEPRQAPGALETPRRSARPFIRRSQENHTLLCALGRGRDVYQYGISSLQLELCVRYPVNDKGCLCPKVCNRYHFLQWDARWFSVLIQLMYVFCYVKVRAQCQL